MGKPKKGKRGDLSDEEEIVTPVEKAVSKKAEKKKGRKKGKGDADSENEDDVPAVDNDDAAPKKKEKKKDKKKNRKGRGSDEESDDDNAGDVVQTQLSKAMKKVKIEDDDDDVPSLPKSAPKKRGGPKSAFAMLTSMDSDDGDGDKDSEEEDKSEEQEPAPKPEKSKKQTKEPVPSKDADAGGKKGKKKKGAKTEENLDEVLAELGIEVKTKEKKKKKKKKGDDEPGDEEVDKEAAVETTRLVDTDQLMEEKEAKVVAPEDLNSEDEEGESRKDRRKKKKEKPKATAPAKEEEEKLDEAGDEEEEEGGVKTAAQKRKEKKERERLKKLEGKQKAESAKPAATVPEPQAKKEVDEAVAASEEKQESAEQADDDEKDDKKASKKDKDKKKKKGAAAAAEEDDKKKKGPSKKALVAMQEALKKLQEDEEARRLAEEEKFRKEEEAENARLEKLRLEKEKKEREKQKKKERISRQKAQGTYLTPKQKEQRARAQAMLEALKAQGAKVPGAKDDNIDEENEEEEDAAEPVEEVKPIEEKKPGPKRVGKPWKQGPKATNAQPAPVPSAIPEKPVVVEEKPAEAAKPMEVEKIKDSWDQDSDVEVKDSWEDAIPDEPKPEKVEEPAAKQAKVSPKEEASEEEEEEESEESEEESSEESESESEEDSEEEDSHKTEAEKRRDRALIRIQKRREAAEAKRTTDVLRQPVVCVLGHVDTGKTKILDKLRRTNVQEGEAGGITQQIGATNVPVSAIEEQCKMVHGFDPAKVKVPGLLIIDTPGHESFSNLRSRGSSLCDIAVLVVDIMHGLEPQTIESINLLKKGKTPFVVALNKIDRLYDWKTNRHKDVSDVINSQATNTRLEFQKRSQEVIVGMAEQGLNAALYYENKDPRTYVSMIPTSALSGDGMGNLMSILVDLTQTMLAKRIAFSEELQATVLEVKALPGLGTTIDVILVNGTLREGDTMVVAGTEGPIVAQIRSLLMPQPMKELRVKNAYKEHKEVRAAQGVKLCAKDLEKTIAGLNLLVAHQPDEVEICKEEVAKELKKVLSSIRLQDRGVYVQASTLGSLEALLEFLKASKIPYSGIRIGPVAKRDVMRASVQLEHDSQYAVILAFDVKVEREAQEMADNLRVRIFQADIIYHLFDQFMAYREELRLKRRRENEHLAVFPCKLKILPQFIFNSRDPIVIGVSVEAGILKIGTPLCVPSKEFVDIGVVASMELNNKPMEVPARKGQEICVKIENRSGDAPRMLGRHFEATDMLVSRISRESIDACKEFFRDDLQKPDWQLMIELKKLFQIL